MRKLVNPFENKEETSNLVTYPSEFLEQQFIDEYFILVRRVKGMGLTLTEFWDMDLFTFGQLFKNELDIIKKEEKEAEKNRLEHKSRNNSTGKMTVSGIEDSEEMKSIYEDLVVN